MVYLSPSYSGKNSYLNWARRNAKTQFNNRLSSRYTRAEGYGLQIDRRRSHDRKKNHSRIIVPKSVWGIKHYPLALSFFTLQG